MDIKAVVFLDGPGCKFIALYALYLKAFLGSRFHKKTEAATEIKQGLSIGVASEQPSWSELASEREMSFTMEQSVHCVMPASTQELIPADYNVITEPLNPSMAFVHIGMPQRNGARPA